MHHMPVVLYYLRSNEVIFLHIAVKSIMICARRETSKFTFTFMVFTFITFLNVKGEDTINDFGIKNPNVEYLNVFQNIPRLFEYLLETLEAKPEILEKNDVTIFKRNAIYESVETYEMAEDSYNEGYIVSDDHDELSDNFNQKENEAFGNIDEFDEAALTNEALTGDFENDPISELSMIITARKIKKYDQLDDQDSIYQGFSDTPNRLTPEEVEEQAIKVEQILEEHNISRRRK